MSHAKYLSTGGAGDAFIVMLKLRELAKGNPDLVIDWEHVESNDLKDVMHPIWELLPAHSGQFPSIGFTCDEAYIQNIEKHKKGRGVIPVRVRGMCQFHKKEWPLENPFLVDERKEIDFDIILQTSAGMDNSRDWVENPLRIAQALSGLGRHVTIVGKDDRFKASTTNPDKVMNLVGRTTLSDVFEIISRAKVLIGHSGLLTFFSMASRVDTIHLEYSKEANKNYLHESWSPYLRNIEIGSLSSIIKELRK